MTKLFEKLKMGLEDVVLHQENKIDLISSEKIDPNIGMKFGDIEIMERTDTNKRRIPKYKYKCICGRIGQSTIYQIKLNKNICSVESCLQFYPDKYIGKKFGDVEIIEIIQKNKKENRDKSYKYKCICGRIGQDIIYSIKRNKNICSAKSCEILYYNKFIGQLVNKWKIISLFTKPAPSATSATYADLICECGSQQTSLIRLILKNKSRSCLSCSSIIHGLSRTPEYGAYNGAKQRCYNIKYNSYRLYGGRGIKMCDRWLNSVENFYQDMGPKPFPDYELDRIDPDGNYEPNNCRWVTAKENTNNRRVSLKNSHLFRMVSIFDLCKKCNEKTLKIDKQPIEVIPEQSGQLKIS